MSGAWKSMLGAAATALLLITPLSAPMAAPGSKRPTGPESAKRVLPAGVEKAVEAAFQRAAPSWVLKTAKVQKVTVSAHVCSDAGACHDLVLADPASGCKGKKVGPWCLSWKGAAPADTTKLESALAQDADEKIWHTISARPKQPDIMEPIPGAAGATGTNGGVDGAKPTNLANGADGNNQGDNTILLLVALAAAAGATFVLFRRDDDEDEAESDD